MSESRKIQFFHVGTSVRQCELCAALWRQMIKSMLYLSGDIHNHLRAVGETARVLKDHSGIGQVAFFFFLLQVELRRLALCLFPGKITISKS